MSPRSAYRCRATPWGARRGRLRCLELFARGWRGRSHLCPSGRCGGIWGSRHVSRRHFV